jgi:hypothetical protein
MPITIYSSWGGLISAAFTPLVLLLLGGYTVDRVGTRPLPIVVTVAGAILALVVLLDYPRRSQFSASGVERICLLRRHLIPWDRISAIQRTRPERPPRRLRPSTVNADWTPGPRGLGGLVAAVGRRRYLLVNQVEGPGEYDELVAALKNWSVPTPLRAARPPESAPPSYLYRRRKT